MKFHEAGLLLSILISNLWLMFGDGKLAILWAMLSLLFFIVSFIYHVFIIVLSIKTPRRTIKKK